MTDEQLRAQLDEEIATTERSIEFWQRQSELQGRSNLGIHAKRILHSHVTALAGLKEARGLFDA